MKRIQTRSNALEAQGDAGVLQAALVNAASVWVALVWSLEASGIAQQASET